jgi:hypothetical protein
MRDYKRIYQALAVCSMPLGDNFRIADKPGTTDKIHAKCCSQRLTLGPRSCPHFTWTRVFSYSLMIGKFVVLCAI